MPKKNIQNKRSTKPVDAIQSDFVNLTSHQLRTPLSSIKWIIELLRKPSTGKLNKKQRDFLDKIYISNEKMITLVNDLLEVSRLESGEAKLYLQPTDLAEVVHLVMREKAPIIASKHIKISLTIEQEPFPYVYSEPNRIKQAFSNILQNSITYSNSHSKIGISLRVQNNGALVEVSDTGVGIPKAEQARMFSKFYRGSNILQFETTGTGLGMYITRAFIEASGGGIWFESKQDKGTSVYFTLPIAK